MGRRIDFSERVAIETGLLQGKSIEQIAKALNRHPSSITNEIKANRTFIRGAFINGRDCRFSTQCVKHGLCELDCSSKCLLCRIQDCRMICERYEPFRCTKIEKTPFVCGSCSGVKKCSKNRYVYSARFADASAIRRRSDSRKGIRIEGEELKHLDELVSGLVKKGQPLAHIYADHKADLPVSLRSLYSYIDGGALSIRNIDLRRKTSYRSRKSLSAKKRERDLTIRKGRTFADFERYCQNENIVRYVQMDTVKGVRERGKCLLTMLFVPSNLMLLFLMPACKADEVKAVFDYLTALLGLETYRELFPLILTDNGSEFQRVSDLEYTDDQQHRTKIFYCDPQASWQKPHIEKNHEFIRYVIPRGKSFTPYNDADILKLMSHINSVKRESLGGQSPYEIAVRNDDFKNLLKELHVEAIRPDDICLNQDLFSR